MEDKLRAFVDEIEKATEGTDTSLAIDCYLDIVKAFELRRIADEIHDLKQVLRGIGIEHGADV